MERIVVVGCGRVAQNFIRLFSSLAMLEGIIGRDRTKVEGLAAKYKVKGGLIGDKSIPKCSIYLVAVADSAIEQVVEQICRRMSPGSIVAHTSGMAPVGKGEYCARFYPLQTFSEGVNVDFSKISIFIDANENEVATRLLDLSHIFCKKGAVISSVQLQKVHLAATFVNNFTNYMYCCAEDILKDENLDLSLLFPLMDEGLKKAKECNTSRFSVQSGAAVRKDIPTISAHRRMLCGEKLEIYDVITKYILNRDE